MRAQISLAWQSQLIQLANLAKAVVSVYQLVALRYPCSCCRSLNIWFGLAQIKVRYQQFGCWTMQDFELISEMYIHGRAPREASGEILKFWLSQ